MFPEPSDVELWRYEDPVLGPRLIPKFASPKEGKSRINNSAIFRCDFESDSLFIEDTGKQIPIGRAIIYIVNDPPAQPIAFSPGDSFSNIVETA